MKNLFKNSIFTTIILCFTLSLSSCFKDSETFDPYPDNPWANLQKVELDVSGEIVDEAGKPIQDVQITANNQTAVTDKNGVFVIKNSLQSPNFIHVKAEKQGFFNGARVIRGAKGRTNVVKIVLLKQNKVASFKASQASEVTVDGVKIKFPNNGYVDAAGKTFDGNINVSAKYLDPTKQASALQMPGDLRAVNFQGQERFLESFGMVYVELTDDNGNKLNLGNGAEAELSFESKNATTHPQIPLWHFDEKLGAWREEGRTTLVNNRYVGKVKHFSCWNCDYQYEKVNAQGRIVDQNGIPMANVWVGLNLVGQPWGGHGLTDGNGYFYGCIPKGQDLELSVSVYGNGCNSVFYKKAVGSFNADVDFGNVVVTIPTGSNPIKSFNGTALDCAGQPLKNGYVSVILMGGGTSRWVEVFTDDNGKYNYTITPSACYPDITNIIVKVVDLASKKESADKTFTLSTGNNDLGTIETCITLSEFIDFKFGDSTYYDVLPQLSEIYMQDSMNNKALYIYFSSKNQSKGLALSVSVNTNPPVAGSYPTYYQYGWNVLEGGSTTTVQPSNQNMTMNLTEVSLVSGGYTAGSISGTMTLQPSGKVINVSGSFRVRKI